MNGFKKAMAIAAAALITLAVGSFYYQLSGYASDEDLKAEVKERKAGDDKLEMAVRDVAQQVTEHIRRDEATTVRLETLLEVLEKRVK